MRFLIGPRQIGKSTKIRELVFKTKHPQVAIVSPTTRLAVHSLHAMARFLDTKKVNYITDALNMTVSWDKRTVHFIGAEFFERRPTSSEFRRMPKFLEDADLILEQFFGTVMFTSATGPNYQWTIPHSAEFIEQARRALITEQFNQEIRSEWTDEEYELENKNQLQNERGPE